MLTYKSGQTICWWCEEKRDSTEKCGGPSRQTSIRSPWQSSSVLINTCDRRQESTWQPRPPHQCLKKTPSRNCTMAMLLQVVSKDNLVTFSFEPFLMIKTKHFMYTKALILLCFLQTTIIYFKSKSRFLTSLCYSKGALGYKVGGGTHQRTTEGIQWHALVIKDLYIVFIRQQHLSRNYRSPPVGV